MEETLRTHLLELSARFEDASGVSQASIGKRALNDNTVFNRLQDRSVTFQVRTYDRLLRWMNANWPLGAVWPTSVPKPGAPLVPNEVRPEAVEAPESAL